MMTSMAGVRKSEQNVRNFETSAQMIARNGQSPARNVHRPAKNDQRPAKNAHRLAKNAHRPVKNAQRPVRNVQSPARNAHRLGRSVQNSERSVHKSATSARRPGKSARKLEKYSAMIVMSQCKGPTCEPLAAKTQGLLVNPETNFLLLVEDLGILILFLGEDPGKLSVSLLMSTAYLRKQVAHAMGSTAKYAAHAICPP